MRIEINEVEAVYNSEMGIWVIRGKLGEKFFATGITEDKQFFEYVEQQKDK